MNLRDEILEYLNYDPETGLFYWKKSPRKKANNGRSSRLIGTIAGYLDKCDGYYKIQLKDKSYLAHRLAFLITYGYMPKELDHVNRNKSDNRILNLREVSHSENNKNNIKHCNNTSGITGVHYAKKIKKWQVQIHDINHKNKFLGYYKDFIEAVYTRWIAENIYNYSNIHGR